jgi:hypothetical protein
MASLRDSCEANKE